MSKPTLRLNPAVEGASSAGGVAQLRPSLFDTREAFIERIAPLATAAIYFGSFSLAPQDISLSRQALFKLSFLNRHFLQPGGMRIAVEKQTVHLSGTVTSPGLVTMAEILARQIDGIRHVRKETESAMAKMDASQAKDQAALESIEFLFVTDQTLRAGVRVSFQEGRLTLDGQVSSEAQKNWAEQLAKAAVDDEIDSRLSISTVTPPLPPINEPPQLDDESLQALVLFRLRLVRATKHLSVKVKAGRGGVTLHGKVRNEALRQCAENVARSTLGIRELRSSLSIAG